MTQPENKEIFAANLKEQMARRNLSRSEVCQALGVRYSTFSDWLNGNAYPRIDKIELLARYFGISKSALIEAPQAAPAAGLNNQDRKEITEILASTKQLLQQQGLMFDGNPANPEEIASIIDAIAIGLELAKKKNKEKYTPKKHKG